MKQKVYLSNIEQIEQWLYDHNVKLIEDNSIMNYDCFDKAFIVKYKDAACLVYAPGAILNNIEKRCVLLHEIYHLITKNGFYYLSDSPQKRKLIEGKVRNRMVKDLVPIEKLMYFIDHKYTQYEMAKELEVTEDIIVEAYQIYYARLLQLLEGAF